MSEQTPAQRVRAYLDARGPDRHNTITSAGPQRYAAPKLRYDDLRAVLADNERLTAEVDEMADFDKADQRRRTLQGERDKAVKVWHEQHKELVEARADKGGLIIDLKVARADYLDMKSEAEQLRQEVERLGRELGETRGKLAAAELVITDYRGFGPCERTDAHPTHLWMTAYRTVRCLGVKDEPPAQDGALPPVDGAGQAGNRPGRAQEGRGGDNLAKAGSEMQAEGPAAE